MFSLVRRARLKKPNKSSGNKDGKGEIRAWKQLREKTPNQPRVYQVLKQAVAVGAGRKAKREMQKVESEMRGRYTWTVETAFKGLERKESMSCLWSSCEKKIRAQGKWKDSTRTHHLYLAVFR